MKLRIKESNFISEAIADIKKYYPNIDDNTFMHLIELDPTYRGKDSAGKYGKWLLNLYNKGNLSEDEFNEVTPLLNQFTTYRNRIQNKDLNSYKSLDALANVLASVIDDDSMLTARQKVRFLKNVKSGKVKTDAEDDYDVVLDTPNFIVYVPNTHEASMKLGKGTKWCTAHENVTHYNRYTENGGKLYIIKNKHTGERWQYSDKENEFLNEYNEEFNILKLMQQDIKLSKFFEKFLGYDASNIPNVYVYDGDTIPKKFKPYITDVITSDNITYIDNFAFDKCTRLKTVTLLNNIQYIGVGAFAACRVLESINIPNSVTYIDRGAFAQCWNLSSIVIPNSVNTLGDYAFTGCDSLRSVKISNSITNIGVGVFERCTNLTVYTNNNYAIEYCKENNIPVKPLNNNESYKKLLKLHIKESISGRIEDTNEKCVMEPNGYWIGANGRKITSYERVDKEIEYDKNGNPVKRQRVNSIKI